MDKNDYTNFPPFTQYDMQDPLDMYRDPMFNPINQYEQANAYYRFLCTQMDYKIKCKEYEKMCKESAEPKVH